jgi:hypothetical protein
MNKKSTPGYFLTRTLLAGLLFFSFRIFAQNPEIKLWEPEIRKFEHLDSVESYPANAILFAGSSSIRFWSTLAKDMAPYPVIQRGYGGAMLSDMAVYASRIIYPHPCRAIVLFVANDITGSPGDKSPEAVLKLFEDIHTTIRAKFPETPVFWIAITPTPSRWKVWSSIKQVNALIQQACTKDNNAHFISTDQVFLNESGLPREELFRPDKLHLNAEGYAVWTGVIRKELVMVLGD